MSQTYITVLLFFLIFLFGAAIEDRCSKFLGTLKTNLTECPPSETFNLLECYDPIAKRSTDEDFQKFWCWSRKDNDEKTIKNVSILAPRVDNDDFFAKINQTFSSQFTFNGSHLKCDTMEKWATESIYVNTTEPEPGVRSCVSSPFSRCTPLLDWSK